MANTYYVDLSTEYDDNWLELNYGAYDDFENGTISSDFNAEFVSSYQVVDMYDEKVATIDGVPTDPIIMSGIENGNFSAEFSFVRTDVTEVPTFMFELDGTRTIYVDWKYLSDTITFYDESGSRYPVIYGNYIKDLDCFGSLKTISIKFEYDSNTAIMQTYYKVDDDWIESTSFTVNVFITVDVKTECTTNTGLGYVNVQANSIDDLIFTGESNGTEENPFTYSEFYDRVFTSGTGDVDDIYKCRNSRKINQTLFALSPTQNYTIDVWNPALYGPWMMVFDNMTESVSFAWCTLLNGIIYNKPSGSVSNLLITNAYDMLLTWNGTQNQIGFIRTLNPYTNDYRADIFGCTLKSAGGTFTALGVN